MSQAAEKLSYRQRRAHGRMGRRAEPGPRRIGVMTLGMDRSLISLPVIAAALGGAEGGLAQAGAHGPAHASAQFGRSAARSPPVPQLDGLILVGALQGDFMAGAETELIPQLRQIHGMALGATTRLLGRRDRQQRFRDGPVGRRASVRAAGTSAPGVHQSQAGPPVVHAAVEDGFVAARPTASAAEVHSISQADPAFEKLPSPAPTTVDAVQRLVIG